MPRRERGPPRDTLIRKGFRGIAGGVGLLSESVKAQKEGKAAEKESVPQTAPETLKDEMTTPINSPPHDIQSQTSGVVHDQDTKDQSSAVEGLPQIEPDHLEDEWNLDDAQDEAFDGSSEAPPGYDSVFGPLSSSSEVKVGSEDDFEDQFIRKHPIPREFQGQQPSPNDRLPLTVVLPQRRPKDRSRGFIRAYAPVLERCGIDQPTWLSFLNTFQKSSAANPWLNAINMAQFAGLALPHPIWDSRRVCNLTGCQCSNRGAISRTVLTPEHALRISLLMWLPEPTSSSTKSTRSSSAHVGLYCLVMTWNPATHQRIQQVDITSSIASRSKDGPGFGYLQFQKV